MTSTTAPLHTPTRGLPLSARAAFEILKRMKKGSLDLTWVDGRAFRFEGAQDGPSAVIQIKDERAAMRILTGGAMAIGESYMDGWIDTPDLPGLLFLGAQNFVVERPKALPHSPRGLLHRIEHALRANTKNQARKNISYHYDLGNDFYKLWLDPSMTYSSALFADDDATLADAQQTKRSRLLDTIDPAPGSHVLEIGCGWGAFAIQAAKERGCRVTGITISQEQHDWARRRVAEEGLEDLVEIRFQDYRDVTEKFDHVASIEMFEAVGEEYWPTFFDAVRARLKPGGSAGLQVITVPDWDFDGYRNQIDFTQKYIFPGGICPSPEVFRAAAGKSGLAQTSDAHFFGQDYAATLLQWLHNFDGVMDEVRAMGFDDTFERMWRFYLAWCNAGFAADYIDVMQVRLEPVRA